MVIAKRLKQFTNELGTKCLQYLDLTNYLAVGTSLSGFYKAYNVTVPKGFFPYEWFDSLEKLDFESLPPKKEFYSLQTKQTITENDYQKCVDTWKNENMKSFQDYVRYYNNLVVVGLIEGIEKRIDIHNSKD